MITVLLPDLWKRLAGLCGYLAIPESPRHVAIIGIPFHRSRDVCVRVLVVVGVNLFHKLWVLLVDLSPDAAESNPEGLPYVRVCPVPKDLKGTVAEIIPVYPPNLWWREGTERGAD